MNFLQILFSKKILKSELSKWAFIAGSTFFLDILLFYLFYNISFSIITANVSAFFFSTLYNFFGHKFLTFSTNAKLLTSSYRYVITLFINLNLNTFLILLFTSQGLDSIYSKIFSSILLLPINFYILQKWVFKRAFQTKSSDMFQTSFDLLAYYSKNYLINDTNSMPARKYHSIKHKMLERGLKKKYFEITLEIGSGDGQHSTFIAHDYKTYIMSDLIISDALVNIADQRLAQILSEGMPSGKLCTPIDVQKINLPDQFADRIIITCVLLHVDDVYTSLNEIKRVLKRDGLIDIYIPNSPGLLYRFSEYIFASLSRKKTKNDLYRIYNLIEHRNNIYNILQLIKVVFSNEKISFLYFPFSFISSWNLNLFTLIRITKLSK